MIYLKLMLAILAVIYFLGGGFFMYYEDIAYENLIYIFIPVMYMVLLYLTFDLLKIKKLNFQFYALPINKVAALVLALLAVAIAIKNFDISTLFAGDYAEIRQGFLNKMEEGDVGILEQLVPILSVYPLVYLMYHLQSKQSFNVPSILILMSLLLIGQTTGGRQIIFQLLILLGFLLGRKFLKTKQGLIITIGFVLIGAWVTLGRFDNPDVNKSQFIEALTPARYNDYLKDNSGNKALKDLIIESSFYFSQSVPAFCNEFNNIELSFFPKYPLAMQPFLERQLYKIGIGSVSQTDRFNSFLDLTDNSGFFPGTWGTGFLDVYFNLGILGGIIFFTIISFILYQVNANTHTEHKNKYRILTSFHGLFIITTFMAPAIFDTLIFFSYITIYFSKLPYSDSSITTDTNGLALSGEAD